jgi:peptidoglycan/xylan/chitin deacetylase (PgdA/CDA1 family)
MLAKQETKQIPILMYHSISRHATPKFKPFTVSPESFADQMAYLRQHAYTAMTVTQLVKVLTQEGSVLPERPIVLTFDDGFADFFTDALPVLQQYGFAATLYVTTGFIGGTSRWMQREGETTRLMLTWEQLTEISACGIECGGHTHSHPQLDTLPRVVARDEIVRCKEIIEDRLGQVVWSFAYPFGYHSATTRLLVQEAGYTSACAVKYAMSSETTDPFTLARLIVKADTSVDAFAALLTEQSSSPIITMYKSARTPLWRVARRFSALAIRSL